MYRFFATSKQIPSSPNPRRRTWLDPKLRLPATLSWEPAPYDLHRPRLERGTYCLGGTFEVRPGSAGCGLTCQLAVPAVAGRGLMQAGIYGRWLPVWLPRIRCR